MSQLHRAARTAAGGRCSKSPTPRPSSIDTNDWKDARRDRGVTRQTGGSRWAKRAVAREPRFVCTGGALSDSKRQFPGTKVPRLGGRSIPFKLRHLSLPPGRVFLDTGRIQKGEL